MSLSELSRYFLNSVRLFSVRLVVIAEAISISRGSEYTPSRPCEAAPSSFSVLFLPIEIIEERSKALASTVTG